MIGLEILNVNNDDYHLLFFADIMHDGTITTHQNLPAELLQNGKPVLEIDDKIYELANIEGYRRFWLFIKNCQNLNIESIGEKR